MTQTQKKPATMTAAGSSYKVGSGRNTVETPSETSLTRPGLFPEVFEYGQLDSMAEEAIALARSGWSVLPCRNKRPLIKAGRGFENALTNPDHIRKWWAKRPDAQIGLPVPEGMLVIDIDPRSGGSMEVLEAVTGPLPQTLTSWSGRRDGGRHLFFRVPEGFSISDRDLPDGVDVRNGGKNQVIAPPSLHNETGKPYTWEHHEIAGFPVDAWKAKQRAKTLAPQPEGPGAGLIRAVATAESGNRNNKLHWALCRAFDDGGDDALINELCDMGLRIGLSESEIKATLESARNTPRQSTQDFGPWSPQRDQQPASGAKRVRLVRASEIKPEKQNWLMHIGAEPVIPDKTCTVFAGIGGEGKSTFAIHVAAQLSRGELEGDYHGQQHSSIIFGPEDDWSSVHVPRLMAAGADLGRIHKVVAEVVTPYGVQEQELRFPIDIDLLEQAVIEARAKLVIVDPISVSMEGDLNKVQDVRDAVGALDALAKKHELTVVLINHFRKGGASVTEKMSGSHALRDVVRAYLAFAEDKSSGDRILTQDKNNYGTGLGSWKFAIQGKMIDTDDGQTEAPYIEMLGTSDVTVKDLIDREHGHAEDDEDRTEWQSWLLEVLEEAGGKTPVKRIKDAAPKAGFNFKTIQNGRSKMKNPKVLTGRDGFGEGSIPYWKLEHYSDPEEDFAVDPTE